ncbi:RNA14 [Candida theae]|uniref:mRNA 3'-end-processing protein RNA14 n=1 Tax=Candida theae TaxID=1198502 RepID=A0AAD5FYA1_9ASCO|nr:RNA14 [Candida theae]KAI5957608.1 RNA14 [Candida theae]
MSNPVFIKSTKTKKLSLDKIGELEDDLKNNPLDYNKWIKYLDHLVAKDNQEQVREAFERYLDIFKFDASQWNKYIKYELDRGEKEKAETLFQKCFATTENVELCRSYVDYVRSVTDMVTGGDKARGTIIQAFEFAVDKVGIDVQSDSLWQDYINFIKSWTPAANWEQQQKTDLIRKVYKKALVVPMENIESMWTQYTRWENEQNQVTAQKFVSEKSAEFMAARSWNTEWQNITKKKLKRTITPHNIDNETVETQMKYWSSWLSLEKKNSLQIKDETLLQKRINYVYKEATYALPFVPQLWFEYVKHLLNNNEESNLGNCISILNEGLKLNPKSLLLSFQIAELFEKDNAFDKAKGVYNEIISKLSVDHKAVCKRLNDLYERVKPKEENKNEEDQEDVEMEDNDTGNDNKINGNTNSDMNGHGHGHPNLPRRPNIPSLPQIPTNLAPAPDAIDSDIAPSAIQVRSALSGSDLRTFSKLKKERDQLVDEITLTYIKFMVASKRAEGMKEARDVFRQARKNESVGYQIYVENALLEHYADNKKTALKVFGVGQKAFPTDGRFLLKFLDYLIMTNDVDKLRSTIQSSDTNISKEISQITEELASSGLDPILKEEKQQRLDLQKRSLRRLYKKYISFSADHLSLDITSSFTKKYEQLFPDDDPIDLFTDRYKLGDINIIKRNELNQDDADDYVEQARKRRKLSFAFDNNDSSSAVKSIQESSRIEQEVIEEEQQDNSSFVGPSIVALMSALPNASYFGLPSENVFNSEKLVTLFSNLPNLA